MNNKICGLIAMAAFSCGCETAFVQQSRPHSKDPSRYSYTRIYCTADNESHFDTVTVDLAKVDAASPAMPFFAKGSSASRAAFAGFESGWGTEDLKARKYHPAPAAQYVVYLDGLMSVTTSDGQTRQFKAGDVLRVEDLAPCKGHISVVVGDRTSYAMVVR